MSFTEHFSFTQSMATTLTTCFIAGLTMVCVCLYGLFGLYPMRRRDRRLHPNGKKVVYAFFHPHASGGGGGERVLWKMIQFLQSQRPLLSHRRFRRSSGGECDGFTGIDHNNHVNESEDDDVEIVIFTIDPPSTDEQDLRLDAERRFDVRIPEKVHLVSLEEYRDYLSPRPFLSLVMESWGTMKLARRALLTTILDKNKEEIYKDCEFVFCDTTGCAFTFAVVRWMCPPSTRILAYVHYPTISTDMMMWEWRKIGNKETIKRRIKTVIKLAYYYVFAVAYGLCGSLADLVMVNSTWTYNHIHSLWRFRSVYHSQRQPIQIVYPPCRVPSRVDNQNIDNYDLRENTIISIGQFRPEKDHKLQIQALSILLKKHPELKVKDTSNNRIAADKEPSATNTTRCNSPVKLLLIGSCRNDSDRDRVDALRRLVEKLDLQDYVIFSINPAYRELQASMARASIGIHTMRQEHFGIGIVEMMAAGLLTIAHDSGGPKSDIILEVGPGGTGFLATTANEYAESIHKALTLDAKGAYEMREKAKASATRFSDGAFDKSLQRSLPQLFC